MSNDIAHNMTYTRSNPAFHAEQGGHSAANINLSMRELLSRNDELVLHNKQLTVALARLKSEASIALKHLTPRQQQIMDLVLEGHPSKNIAADLRISQRTVENHRAAIMRRTGAASLPALVRLSLGSQ
jgi:two-component system, chemotaxis family, CheB/CheR fusion protein